MKSTLFRRLFACLLLALAPLIAAPVRADPPDAGPALRPTSRPTSPPTSRPADARQQRLMELTRRTVQLLQAKKVEQAEQVLGEALLIAPAHPINLYNMACIKALLGRTDSALDFLEKSVKAGYVEFAHLQRDPDLESLREEPRYKELLANKEEHLRRGADRALNWLKRELGEGYLYEIDAKEKLIFATNTDRATLEALKKTLLMQAASQWTDLFSHRPDQYISIVLPSADHFRQIVPQLGVGGFYNNENRILIAQRLGQVMTHEFTHALHAADLDPLGQRHPIWLIEGIAAMYEAARFEGEKLVPADNFRLAAIQHGARSRRLIPLQRLLTMDQKAFVAQATFSYGQAGSLMLYLHEQKLLRRFYDVYKVNYDKDPTGRATLEAVCGKKLEAIEKEWKTWMLGRKPPVFNSGPEGPVIGARFDEANDGLRVGGLVPNGPAAREGVVVGDVIVGIDTHDVRDANSFLPLLATYAAGDRVMLKLRRGEEYLEIALTLVPRSVAAQAPTSRPSGRPTASPRRRGFREGVGTAG